MLAAGPTSAWRRALRDSLYWVRALGFVLVVFGAIGAVLTLWRDGWHAHLLARAWHDSHGAIESWWCVPVMAGAGICAANLLDRAPAHRQRAGFLGWLAGSVLALSAMPAVIWVAWLFAKIFTPAFGHPHGTASGEERTYAVLAGSLLLLQLGILYFLKALTWVGEPTAKANLGSIFLLQRRLTPKGVVQCLERWRSMLSCRWNEKDQHRSKGPAAEAMREILCEALWRDMFGFIPVYAVVFCFGLWFGATRLHWEYLQTRYLGLPLWGLLPLVALVADYLEDLCHLRYLTLHKDDNEPAAALTLFSFAMSVVKFGAFVPAGLLTLWAVFCGSFRIGDNEEGAGWRGTAALFVSVVAAIAILAILIGAAIFRIRARQRRR